MFCSHSPVLFLIVTRFLAGPSEPSGESSLLPGSGATRKREFFASFAYEGAKNSHARRCLSERVVDQHAVNVAGRVSVEADRLALVVHAVDCRAANAARIV